MDPQTAKTAMWYGLTFLFVVGGFGLAYALIRTGRLLAEVQESVHEATDEAVPVIAKAGEGVEAVNDQLRKVDLMMDSAVDAVEAADVAVRAVSMAVTEPVKIASGAVAGVTEAVTSFRARVVADGTTAPTSRSSTTVEGRVEASPSATAVADPPAEEERAEPASGDSSGEDWV